MYTVTDKKLIKTTDSYETAVKMQKQLNAVYNTKEFKIVETVDLWKLNYYK